MNKWFKSGIIAGTHPVKERFNHFNNHLIRQGKCKQISGAPNPASFAKIIREKDQQK
jgi:hypothetical protein